MDIQTLAQQIAEAEWPMFHTVNGGDRTDCQNDQTGFMALRKAQFTAWSEEAAQSYLRDLEEAAAQGRNLIREKYIHMMKSTDPKGYEAFRSELPPVSAEKEKLVADIWAHMLAQTQKMREKYPAVALGGRPLLASEEADGSTSVETYQTGELLTYSENTLAALLRHIEALEARGIDLAFEVQRNSITWMGYKSMEEAERTMAYAFLQSMGGGECTTCGALETMTML